MAPVTWWWFLVLRVPDSTIYKSYVHGQIRLIYDGAVVEFPKRLQQYTSLDDLSELKIQQKEEKKFNPSQQCNRVEILGGQYLILPR